MRERWFCANCLRPGELDCHGRCITCGSDQVDTEHRHGLASSGIEAREVAELEKMLGIGSNKEE